MKIAFLGTPLFVQPVKNTLAKHFVLVNSLNDADLAVVAAYGKVLTERELNTLKLGALNIHPSLLPKYRGPSPIQCAILNGDKTSGITIIKMDTKVDHGPILYQEELELSDYDNFDTLSKKMFLRASEVLPKIIAAFLQGKITPKEQNHQFAAYCKELKKEAGYFDINNPPPAEKLDKMIRAYYPWPGTWSRWKEKIIKFYPGNEVQMEGKKVLSAKDFLNGYPNFPLKAILFTNTLISNTLISNTLILR